jgi:hypothetical protein
MYKLKWITQLYLIVTLVLIIRHGAMQSIIMHFKVLSRVAVRPVLMQCFMINCNGRVMMQ